MITLEEIRKIHKKTIEADRSNPDDYAPGERYIAIVELMLEYKISAENTIFLNAAIVLQTIAAQHPFVNGNKRTAITAATAIIENEGYKFTIDDDSIFRFVKDVATPEKSISIEKIEKWFQYNTRNENEKE